MLRNLKKSEETGENTVLFAWGGVSPTAGSALRGLLGGGSALTPTGGLPGRVEERVGGGRWVGSTASWRGSTGKRKRIRAWEGVFVVWGVLYNSLVPTFRGL